MLTMSMLKKHIKRCKAKQVRFNFLGLVENKNLAPEVERLFKFITPSGYVGYDWINGNPELKTLINAV